MNKTLQTILRLVLGDRTIITRYKEVLKGFEDRVFLMVLFQAEAYYTTHPEANSIELTDILDFISISGVDDYLHKEIERIYSISIEHIDNTLVLEYINNKTLYTKLYKLISEQIDKHNLDLSSILSLIREHGAEDPKLDESESLSLADHDSSHDGWYWPLTQVNEIIGPVGPQHSGIIFARPETGKTGLVIHVIQNFLDQGAVVLDVNTEDPVQKRLERYYMCHFGKEKGWVYGNIDEASSEYTKKFKGKLHIHDVARPNLGMLENWIKRIKPDIVVCDQADSFAVERSAQAYEDTYAGLRALGKDYDCTVLMVTQAGAESGTYLTLEDIYGSKTGKGANVDFVLGMSATGPDALKRTLSFPKNKIRGIHGTCSVNYNRSTMRFEDGD